MDVAMTNPEGTRSDQLGRDVQGNPEHGQRTAGDDLAQSAADLARAAKQQARETTEEVARDAREVAGQVKEQAYSAAGRQKDVAAQRMGGWAQALRSASDDLRSRGQEMAASYVGQAAEGLERASDTVRARDVDDLVGAIEDFARRQPVAFLGGAVAAGFGLARFMRSSADRRRSSAASARTGQGDAL
jgi:hypothetical protein